jgi:hypothetical protein
MAKNKYVVLAGTHHDVDGTAYKAGDVVTSEHDLQAQFREKFRKLDTPPLPPAPEVPQVAVSQQPLEPQPTNETSRTTLEQNPVAANTATADKGKAADSDDEGSAEGKGTDVSKDFPKATENDFLVFKKGRKHYVYDGDKPEAVLNQDGANKGDVDGIIEGALRKGK